MSGRIGWLATLLALSLLWTGCRRNRTTAVPEAATSMGAHEGTLLRGYHGQRLRVSIVDERTGGQGDPQPAVDRLHRLLAEAVTRGGAVIDVQSPVQLQVALKVYDTQARLGASPQACVTLAARVWDQGGIVSQSTATDCRLAPHLQAQANTEETLGYALQQAFRTLLLGLNRASETGNSGPSVAASYAQPNQAAVISSPEASSLPALVVPQHASRVALIIGNSAYTEGRLRNPVNDARLIAGTLRSLQFNVELVLDADQNAMKRAIDSFGNKLRPGGIALFFFAGHGVQVKGRNYLIPLRARIEREGEVDIESIDVERVLSRMDAVSSSVNLVILDACRNNPFTRAFRSLDRGLAFVQAPRGTLIAYATAPGEEAQDGDAGHSPYTAALASEMTKAAAVEEMFKAVRRRVQSETHDLQTPWESSSLTVAFSFVSAPSASPARPEAARPPSGSGTIAPAKSVDEHKPNTARPVPANATTGSEDDIE